MIKDKTVKTTYYLNPTCKVCSNKYQVKKSKRLLNLIEEDLIKHELI